MLRKFQPDGTHVVESLITIGAVVVVVFYYVHDEGVLVVPISWVVKRRFG